MGGTPWAAVVVVGRNELRRRWRAVVALGVLAGLVGGVLLGAAGLTRRTVTAPERLVATTQLDHARVSLFGGAVEPAQVQALPGIEASRVLRQVVGQLAFDELGYVSVAAGPTSERVLTPVVVQGRAPDPAAADETLVVEEFAEAFGVSVGDDLPLRLLTAQEVAQFDTGFGEPDGPAVTLRVVGLARLAPAWAGGTGLGPVLATPAFAEQVDDVAVSTSVLVRLDDDSAAGRERFAAAVAGLGDAVDAPTGAEEFPPVSVELLAADGGSAVQAARTSLLTGLLVLSVVAGLAGVLALAQACARHAASSAHEQRVEAALGMTARDRVLARMLPAGVAVLVAVAVAVPLGLVAGLLQPLGALAAYEPDPGWAPDAGVLSVGAVALVLVVLALVAGTAGRAGAPDRAGAPAAPGRATRLSAATRHAPVAAGATFALAGGSGRHAVPVRTTLAGAVLGIAGVVAATTFATSLDRLAAEPARYGWAADFAWIDAKEPGVQELVDDPAVAAVTWVDEGGVRLEGRDVSAFAGEARKGEQPWTVLDGRAPRRDDEIALGSRLATELGVEVGDTVTLERESGPARLRVVGRLVLPVLGSEPFGDAVLLTRPALAQAGRAQPFAAALVRTAAREDAEPMFRSLARDLELARAAPPQDVRSLLDLGRLPHLLSAFLGVLSTVVLLHALVLTTRRRASDLAVLRVLGFTPRQTAGAVVAMAGTTALVGLVVGVPLGLAVGRVVWWEVADSIGVAGDAALPVAALAVLAPVVVLAAVVVALLPARRAARISPAQVLRAE